MNADIAEMLDSELLKDAEATAQRPSLAAPPDLPTARMVSITPPPPGAYPAITGSVPPLPPMSIPPQARVPVIQQPVAEAPRAPRPSWIDALLATTFPPPSQSANPEHARAMRRRAGAAFVGLALAFALVAMITGLRGAPDDPSIAPVVAAALVLAHALVAIGAGAFSFGLLRMAERLVRD